MVSILVVVTACRNASRKVAIDFHAEAQTYLLNLSVDYPNLGLAA